MIKILNKLFYPFLTGSVTLFAILVFNYGIRPTFNNTRGDFANYYTAAQLIIEGAPIERAYQDFIWFQMQMDRSGIVHQVGGFIPHPPSTALVFLPLIQFDALTAKRIWTLINIVLVVLIVFVMSRITQLNWLLIAFIVLGTGMGLINNFLFGQQYLLLVATIVLGLWAEQKGYPVLAGFLIGILIPVKYVGLLFVVYFAWKRQWRLVLSASATILAIVTLTALIAGLEPFTIFITDVLPRHIRGEIQDPFAVQFQSWNSLLRRLFVYNETLNPNPIVHFPAAFFILKNIVFGGIIGLAIVIFTKNRFDRPDHQYLFEIGSIPLLFLLISPGGATYHFLLLTLTAAAYIKILVDHNRAPRAAFLAALFIAINLPHYMKLLHFAHGWTIPLAYPRLWLLAIFAIIAWLFLRPSIHLQPSRILVRNITVALIILVITFTTTNLVAASKNSNDSAHWLKVEEPEFNRHLGLILKHLDSGNEKLLFSYCELRNEQYTIFSTNEGRWTPLEQKNYYYPDLAPDDSTLLVQTVANGRNEIWLSAGQAEPPEFLFEGEYPTWIESPSTFAFVRDGVLYQAEIDSNKVSIKVLFKSQIEKSEIYDLAYSSRDSAVAFCVNENAEYAIYFYDLMTGETEKAIEDTKRIEQPAWSADGDVLLFAWKKNGNRDIWAIDLQNQRRYRLTTHRGEDTSPVWDGTSNRILFTSDRDRGLEFSTIFWILIPPELKQVDHKSASS